MGIIKASRLVFDYIKRDEDENIQEVDRAIDHLDVDIEKGSFVAILGHNGSGKSTFAKQINGILTPTEGTVWVSDRSTAEEEAVWEIRKKAGMVFQNPDNQIIGNVVEEDVGFGPENIGVPTDIPTWGNILNAAKNLNVIQNYPVMWIGPGVAISLFVLGVNFLGDGLRDVLDPT